MSFGKIILAAEKAPDDEHHGPRGQERHKVCRRSRRSHGTGQRCEYGHAAPHVGFMFYNILKPSVELLLLECPIALVKTHLHDIQKDPLDLL